ncbi:MAG TPA: PAS domain-containing sensor histidine kinase [Burkholderiales bacterium]|nr:PAS domain-containing sensor histidine kinase [Burkholderiales bacterium]
MAPDRTVTHWFRGAEHVFGYEPREMLGRPATQLFNADDIERGAERHEFEVAISAGRAEDDRWHVRKDGTQFWGSGALFALRDKAGSVTAFAKMVRNRTDVKTQTEALENQVKALAKAHEQKNLFLGMLAHELRNPLGALANAVELIRQSGLADPMGFSALQVIDRQAAALRRLTDDLMDITRIGAGKIDLQLQVIDLKDVVHAAAVTARPPARARHQELQEILIEGPVPVNADALRLQQVFSNLLDNAIKYTPEKGKIVFNLTTEGGDAIVRVEDTGIGMSADILPKVFELFTQEDSSRKNAQGGVGLGLSLVRQLVQLHGGTVQARSDGRGKGSVFTVRLPLYGVPQA